MPTRRAKVLPRKQPKQDRARATVDAILQATTYILVRDGWEGLTTNKIAQRAGVNVASLYQYFPNKQSIVVELQKRHVERARQTQPQDLQLLRRQPDLRSILRVALQRIIAEHRDEPALHRVFAEELPRSTRRAIQLVDGVQDQKVQQAWKACIEAHGKPLPDRDIAAFIVTSVVHAVIHDAAAIRPELLESAMFTEELVTLIERYLVRSR
jgi:AcrR family transcriptional regulator